MGHLPYGGCPKGLLFNLVRVTGDVVSASCGRNSEQKEAPRSTSEIRQYRVVGHRKSDRTRRVQVNICLFKQKKHLTFKLSAFKFGASDVTQLCFANLPCLSTQCFAFGTRPHTFRLKTVHRTVFFTPKPS